MRALAVGGGLGLAALVLALVVVVVLLASRRAGSLHQALLAGSTCEQLAVTELALEDGAIWSKDLARTIEHVVLEVTLFDYSVLGDYLTLAMQLVILELSLHDLAVLLGDAA